MVVKSEAEKKKNIALLSQGRIDLQNNIPQNCTIQIIVLVES